MRQTRKIALGRQQLILFHATSPRNARSILRNGFRDGTGRYMTDRKFKGVWFSAERDLAAGFVAHRDYTVLEVGLDVSEEELSNYEWVEEGKGYREWLIPASKVNGWTTSIRMVR